jgi:hypothetical protein
MATPRKRQESKGSGRAATAANQEKKRRPKAKKVTGTVLKIVNGKPTNERLAAEKAFGDLAQAREQVVYVEKHGSREEKRLVRLAFRQYQNMRFRTK